jgi:hypothetical protein
MSPARSPETRPYRHASRFARLLGLVERLLAQTPKDKNKIYALHAPEVVCLAKGKVRAPYEFGAKIGIAEKPGGTCPRPPGGKSLRGQSL